MRIAGAGRWAVVRYGLAMRVVVGGGGGRVVRGGGGGGAVDVRGTDG